MAEIFTPRKMNLSEINGGVRYENGDIVDANAINAPIEAAALVQSLATNEPDTSEINQVGYPQVSIVGTPDAITGEITNPRLKFKNMKPNGIERVYKETEGNIDYYSMLFSNGETFDFEVRNAEEADNSEFANTLKTTASGEALLLDDISPLQSKINVSLSSESLPSDTSVTAKTFGKNWIPYPYYDTTKTTYGITFTDNGDGSVTINGQNDGTNDSLFFLMRNASISLPVTNYFVTLNVDSSLRVRFVGRMANNSYPIFQGLWTPNYSVPTALAELYIQIPKSNTTQFTNVRVYPQFEVGSVKTSFELFKQGQTITTTLAQGAELSIIRPNMTILTDTAGAVISTEYNQDTNVVVGKLYKEIENLKTTIVELGGTT